MDFALLNQLFSALNQGVRTSRMLPQNTATFHISTHHELGHSDLLHYHDEPHLALLLTGDLLDKRKNTMTEIGAGELVFFHAGEPHETIAKTFPTKYFSLQFQSDFFQKNPAIEKNLDTALAKGLDAKFQMLKIYKELAVNDEFSASSIEMLLTDLIAAQNDASKHLPVWLQQITEFLHDNWQQEISLAELAHTVNVHPKTISKYFPKYFQCTLGEYRRKIKIEKSLALIKSSKLSLTEIAYYCGFYDQSHFAATFKTVTGFRPKQFQRL